jgi:hypothetical protein
LLNGKLTKTAAGATAGSKAARTSARTLSAKGEEEVEFIALYSAFVMPFRGGCCKRIINKVLMIIENGLKQESRANV